MWSADLQVRIMSMSGLEVRAPKSMSGPEARAPSYGFTLRPSIDS